MANLDAKIPANNHLASLCSLALVVWGWQTGFWFLAVPMLLVLEARRAIQQRWELSLGDLKAIATLCSILTIILLVVLLITERSLFIYSLLQWLPLCAFPLVAAQTYSTNVLIILRDFFSNPELLRRGIKRKRNPVNLYYPYFALCLLSASAADDDHFGLYIASATLIAVLLWMLRPKRSRAIAWVLMLLLSVGLGFVGALQLQQFQSQIEQQVGALLANAISGSGSFDPYQTSTRMGSIGTLKQSKAIHFRVAGDRDNFPLLLREATYNKYGMSAWVALKAQFEPLPPEANKTTWRLAPTQTQVDEATEDITVSTSLKRGKGVLTLPAGATELRQLPVEELQRNQYGSVKVQGNSGAIAYDISFHPSPALDGPPTDADLQIPDSERPALQQTLRTIGITDSERSANAAPNPADADVVNQVAAFFQDFEYSLKLANPDQAATPMADFLLNTRSGHCEYFASATTLLLREAGIPARYAVGYSVHDYSSLEGQYVVRSRDAHAWTMAYVNGAWQVVDTTPPDWTAQESAGDSPLQILSDFWAFLGFQLSLLIRWIAQVSVWWLVAALIPPLGFILWKNLSQLRAKRLDPSQDEALSLRPKPVKAGLDSEFYQIERYLEAEALARLTSESLTQWFNRLRQQLPLEAAEQLQPILQLHYRYRFDPEGLNADERQQLRTLSEEWLSHHNVRRVEEAATD